MRRIDTHHQHWGPVALTDDELPQGRRGPGGHEGPDGPGGRRRGGRGSRRSRGEVRTAILALLAEEPMHGYQLMQAIADRTNGTWAPSPGAVYPTLSQLEDEGLVEITADQGRKLATITEQGRQAAAGATSDPFAGDAETGPDVRGLMHSLGETVRLSRGATPAQRERVAAILKDARKQVLLALAEDED